MRKEKEGKGLWALVKATWAFLKATPGFVWFSLFFAGGFLPEDYGGKAFASLAGIVLALFLLRLVRGRKRYVVAVFLPVITCLLVRFASGGVYLCVTDVNVRGFVLGKSMVFYGAVLYYFGRLWETILSFGEVGTFAESFWANYLFILILVGMIVCLTTVFFRKSSA